MVVTSNVPNGVRLMVEERKESNKSDQNKNKPKIKPERRQNDVSRMWNSFKAMKWKNILFSYSEDDIALIFMQIHVCIDCVV